MAAKNRNGRKEYRKPKYFLCLTSPGIFLEHKVHKEPQSAQSAQSSEPSVFNVVSFVKKSFVAFVA